MVATINSNTQTVKMTKYLFVMDEPAWTEDFGVASLEIQSAVCCCRKCCAQGIGTLTELTAEGWRTQWVYPLSNELEEATRMLNERPRCWLDTAEPVGGNVCPYCAERQRNIVAVLPHCVVLEFEVS